MTRLKYDSVHYFARISHMKCANCILIVWSPKTSVCIELNMPRIKKFESRITRRIRPQIYSYPPSEAQLTLIRRGFNLQPSRSQVHVPTVLNKIDLRYTHDYSLQSYSLCPRLFFPGLIRGQSFQFSASLADFGGVRKRG